MADGIRQERIPISTIDVSAGMDSRNKPWLVAENGATFLENVRIDRTGAIRRREGAASIGAASGASNTTLPYGLFPFYDRRTFGAQVLYSVNGGKAFLWPGNAQVLEKGCGMSLTSALHMASRGLLGPSDVIYISQAQLHDSTPSLASMLQALDIDNNLYTSASMAPLCTTWWQGRLWVGGNRLAETLDTLWWSSLNNGLYYSLTNTIQVEPGRGGRITGLLPIRALSPDLLIFKEDMIALFTVVWGTASSFIPGPSDALDTIASSVRVVAENVGCVATRSIQYVPGAGAGDIFFLSKDGFRAISRAADDTVSGAALPISAIIQDEVDRINFAHAHKAVSAVIDQKYHCAVPLDGATENTHVFTLDLITNAWYLNTWDVKDFAVARLNQTQDRLLFQNNVFTQDSTVSGLIGGWHTYRAFSGNIDPGGQPVRYTFDTRAYTFGALGVRKKWSWVGFQVENDNATSVLDVMYRLNDGEWLPLGSLAYPAGEGNLITLGEDPLPWTPRGVLITYKKLNMEDIEPGYTMQFRVVQTSASDFGAPSIILHEAVARIIDPEFDNTIT